MHPRSAPFEAAPRPAQHQSIRLLHIIASVDPRGGGPVEGVKQRGLFLAGLGHRVEVLSLDAPSADWVRDFPLPMHAVGPGWSGYRWTPRLRPWLWQHAQEYDHIVINGMWQFHCHGAARALQRMGKAYSVFVHGMLDPWFRHTYPLKHFKKWIYWQLSEADTLRQARHVFFTSEEERLRARESFQPYRVNEVVVPYGTTAPPDTTAASVASFHAAHPGLEGKRLLLFLGRIHEKKGCDLLVKAFAAVAAQDEHAHLVIAGPAAPAQLAGLQALAEQGGVAARITWVDMLKGAPKWAAFHAAQAFVLPSHQENFGIAVAEALACGLPVLISDKVNIWREIQQDGAGLVAPDTLDGTVDTLRAWFAMPEERKAAMAQAARACFERRYTISAMAHGLLQALE